MDPQDLKSVFQDHNCADRCGVIRLLSMWRDRVGEEFATMEFFLKSPRNTYPSTRCSLFNWTLAHLLLAEMLIIQVSSAVEIKKLMDKLSDGDANTVKNIEKRVNETIQGVGCCQRYHCEENKEGEQGEEVIPTVTFQLKTPKSRTSL